MAVLSTARTSSTATSSPATSSSRNARATAGPQGGHRRLRPRPDHVPRRPAREGPRAITRADIAVGTPSSTSRPSRCWSSRGVTERRGHVLVKLGAILYRVVGDGTSSAMFAGLPLVETKLVRPTPRLSTGRPDAVARGFESVVARALANKVEERYAEGRRHAVGAARRPRAGPPGRRRRGHAPRAAQARAPRDRAGAGPGAAPGTASRPAGRGSCAASRRRPRAGARPLRWSGLLVGFALGVVTAARLHLPSTSEQRRPTSRPGNRRARTAGAGIGYGWAGGWLAGEDRDPRRRSPPPATLCGRLDPIRLPLARALGELAVVHRDRGCRGRAGPGPPRREHRARRRLARRASLSRRRWSLARASSRWAARAGARARNRPRALREARSRRATACCG